MQDNQETEEITTARYINGSKFYPIHLTNEELSILIKSLLKLTGFKNEAKFQVFMRQDKASKGIDFRLQNTKGMYGAIKLFTFAINAHWKMVDFFVHQNLKHTYYRYKTVDVFYSDEEQNYNGLDIPEIDSIYVKRLNASGPLNRNELFYREEWTCVYEKQNALAK